jgi:hypothetical protein
MLSLWRFGTVGILAFAGIAVAFMVRNARKRPIDHEEQLRLLIGPRGMAQRDRNRNVAANKHDAELAASREVAIRARQVFTSLAIEPHQSARRQQHLRPELKPYLTQLCKIHATTKGFLSPEINKIGQDIYDKHGHESMVAVCDELRRVLGAGPARDLEYKWDGIGEWQG